MSKLISIIEACDCDTQKALRQGGKAISGTFLSWSYLAKECLTAYWTDDEEKYVIEWGANWSKKIKKHDETTYLFWSAWSCSINADLQRTGNLESPYYPFKTCEWSNINLTRYKRFLEGVLGKGAVYAWLSASDEYKKDCIWWATSSAKTMLQNNNKMLTWILDNTMDIPIPMMGKVWKGLRELNQKLTLQHSRNVKKSLHQAINQIEQWSEARLKNGLEPLELSNLFIEQPLFFWKQIINNAVISDDKLDYWISPHVDSELSDIGARYSFEKWLEKWDWLRSQSKLCQVLMGKPDLLSRFKSSWPNKLREKWVVEIEKSALSHNKKLILNEEFCQFSNVL